MHMLLRRLLSTHLTYYRYTLQNGLIGSALCPLLCCCGPLALPFVHVPGIPESAVEGGCCVATCVAGGLAECDGSNPLRPLSPAPPKCLGLTFYTHVRSHRMPWQGAGWHWRSWGQLAAHKSTAVETFCFMMQFDYIHKGLIHKRVATVSLSKYRQALPRVPFLLALRRRAAASAVPLRLVTCSRQREIHIWLGRALAK